jgi:hypothetical protein
MVITYDKKLFPPRTIDMIENDMNHGYLDNYCAFVISCSC